jgi:hypothetical protein
MPAALRGIAAEFTCDDISADRAGFLDAVITVMQLDGAAVRSRRRHLIEAVVGYERIRESTDRLWQECHGKGTMRNVAQALGFADDRALEARVMALWDAERVARPDLVSAARAYIEQLPLMRGS